MSIAWKNPTSRNETNVSIPLSISEGDSIKRGPRTGDRGPGTRDRGPGTGDPGTLWTHLKLAAHSPAPHTTIIRLAFQGVL